MYKEKLENRSEDLTRFKEMTDKFYAKELSVKDYKGFSGFFGSYAQKGGESSMLRLRMSCGRITRDKLKFIVDTVNQYKIQRIHFTTCQTVQLHDLNAQSVCEIMKAALDHGIVTLGGGGDFPRNVMCSPLSGVEQDEYFDVIPYGMLAADYLLSLLRELKMPRKLKVAFAGSDQNSAHVTFRDLGFLARADGCFDVYSAGGLGPNPKMGLLVAEHVNPNKVLYYIRAMIDTFVENGDYENRAKARTRYMQDRLGTEGYVNAYRTHLEKALAAGGLDHPVHQTDVTKTGQTAADEDIMIKNGRLIPQKQQGLYAVSYHPAGGVPGFDRLEQIYRVIENMDQVELRLAPDQTLYIINCTAEEAKAVCRVTADGALNRFETSVSCIGGTVCQNGARDSQGLLKRLIGAARQEGFADGVLPQIHISGCPSSCGTHQAGILGFHGGVKMIDQTAYPAYTIHVNGNDTALKERFGEQKGVILEEDIPAFLIEIGKAVQAKQTVFEEWIRDGGEKFDAIAQKYVK